MRSSCHAADAPSRAAKRPAFTRLAVSMVVLGIAFTASFAAMSFIAAPTASADENSFAFPYGPDGYFSTLMPGAKPVAESGSFHDQQTIEFGPQGVQQNWPWGQLSGQYKVLGLGPIESQDHSYKEDDADASLDFNTWSATTSLQSGEALLFDTKTQYPEMTYADEDAHVPFDNSNLGYQSNLFGYFGGQSTIETSAMSARPVEGVCVSNCTNYPSIQDSISSSEYAAFPLSTGDLNTFFGVTSLSGTLEDDHASNIGVYSDDGEFNDDVGYWLRSPVWSAPAEAVAVNYDGYIKNETVLDNEHYGLRTAFRLDLSKVLLTAYPARSGSGCLNPNGQVDYDWNPCPVKTLTLLDSTKDMNHPQINIDSHYTVSITEAGNNPDIDGYGWKLVDPTDPTKVVESGFVGKSETFYLPDGFMDFQGTYDLWYWGQKNGSASAGLSNTATNPLRVTIKNMQAVPYEVTIPAAYTLDGGKPGDAASWVGDTHNVKIDVGSLPDPYHIVRLTVQDISDLDYEHNIAGCGPLPFRLQNYYDDPDNYGNTQEGDYEEADEGYEPMEYTIRANWGNWTTMTAEKVPDNACVGTYTGTVTFRVSVYQ